MTAELLSVDQALEALLYDPETGVLTWLIKPSAKVTIGAIAGKVRATDGYRIIRYRGQYFYAHRLAFRFSYGRDPVGVIDHINGNRDDNRLANLREADPTQSNANQKRRIDNKSGYKGVQYYHGHKLWRAKIRSYGKQHTIGYFATAEEAHEAYCAEAARVFGKFARTE